jgi:serine/threonine-protein kinase
VRQERRGRRRRLLIALGTVVGLVALAVGGYAGYQLFRPEHEVPRLEAEPASEVDALVGDLGFDVQLVGVRRNGAQAGTVVAQDPAAGEKLREGETLTVTVSRGPELVTLPDGLTNVAQDEARRILTEAGFRVGFVSEKYNELVNAGTVQSVPTPFTELPRGSAVDLVVSLGPRPRTVPADAIGRSYEEVAAELEELSLQVVRQEEPTLDQAEGTVTHIDPGPGTSVPRDSTVTVFVAVARIEVPDVTGLEPDDAADALEAEGLTVSRVIGPPNRDVTETDPPPGTFVDPGTAIVLSTR